MVNVKTTGFDWHFNSAGGQADLCLIVALEHVSIFIVGKRQREKPALEYIISAQKICLPNIW